MIGEEAELVALRFAEVGGVGFLEEQEKVNDVIFGQIQVDDPRSPALAPPDQRHTGLAQTPATYEKIAPLRVYEQFILERPEVLISDMFGELARKQRGFHEGECHKEGIQCNPF